MLFFSSRFTIPLIVVLLFLPSGLTPGSAGHAQDRQSGRVGAVRGTAIDGSGGVLPGVTVVARDTDGGAIATTLTGPTGEFLLEGLAVGAVDLVLQLEGFNHSTSRIAIRPGEEVRVVERLSIAALSESVVVRGEPLPPPPPPPPTIVPVPAHDPASVCGPAKADTAAPQIGTIRARRNDAAPRLYASGDELLIDGGTLNGLGVGQNLVVRRRFRTLPAGPSIAAAVGEHTSGLLQIVSVEAHAATAVVVYACDEMMKGDYLAAFSPEPIRVPDEAGPPVFAAAARVLFADEGQMLGVTRRMMVIGHGSQQGIRPGQRLTIFRRPLRGGAEPAIVGDAVVVAVRAESATIRVERATDAIFFGDDGDWAAPQRPAAAASDF